jgi:hypothetical protein
MYAIEGYKHTAPLALKTAQPTENTVRNYAHISTSRIDGRRLFIPERH